MTFAFACRSRQNVVALIAGFFYMFVKSVVLLQLMILQCFPQQAPVNHKVLRFFFLKSQYRNLMGVSVLQGRKVK